MSSQDLLSRVRELRRAGLPAAPIARELGMRKPRCSPCCARWPARTTPPPPRPLPEPGARELVGCWISPDWSAGLGLDDAPDWAATDPQGAGDPTTGGLAAVMVARADRSSRVTLCGYLVDVYCLGVKNTLGPLTVSSSAVQDRSRRFFSGFPDLPRSPPGAGPAPRPRFRGLRRIPWASTRTRSSPTSSPTSARPRARAAATAHPGTSPARTTTSAR
jgi:hypothetical protein